MKLLSDTVLIRPSLYGSAVVLCWLTLALFIGFSSSTHAATATSVTVRNVTWNFSTSRTVGQYANGDWWVVGPVTITSITPRSSNAAGWWQHGTQLNGQTSGSVQGFDSSMSEGGQGPSYSAALNVDPGHTGSFLTVTEGTVIKSISRSSRPSVRGTGSRPQLQSMEYLTVVTSEPAANSFRPPPVGTNKTSRWTTNNLNYSLLRNLPVLSGAPSKEVAENWFLRPWPSFITDNQGRWLHPIDNMPEYGRDFGRRLGQGGLVLHSDVGDKTTLMIRMVQIGIDTHASIAGDRFFTGFGGINCGWKWPALLAGLALGDATIQFDVSGGVTTPGSAPNASRLNFSFDRQTWYVLESDVGRVLYTADSRQREPYTQAHVGLPEWGEQHWKQANRDGSNWGAPYRSIAFAGEFAGILSAVLIPNGAGVTAWGWPATIDYMDRYLNSRPGGAVGSAPNNLSVWEGAMYAAYRGLASSGGGGSTLPIMTNPTASQIANDSARLSWSISVPVSAHGLRWGATTQFGNTLTNTATTTAPSFTLSGLSPSTTYFWQAFSSGTAGNTVASPTNSFTTTAGAALVPPQFSRAGGDFVEPQTISITTTSSGAALLYTTNGTDPATSGTPYLSPLTIGTTTTLRAVARQAGIPDSSLVSDHYHFGPWGASDEFYNIPFLNRTGSFDFWLRARVNQAGSDAVLALGNGPAVSYADNAVLVRFAVNNRIEARNGGSYSALNPLTYQPGQDYTFRIRVDVPARRYSVLVADATGAATVIASNYAFRTERANESTFNNFCFVLSNPEDELVVSYAGFLPPEGLAPSRPITPRNVNLLSGIAQ